MSTNLANLQNKTRPYKARKRVGRGPGSGTGKTCGRGQKGMGSRSGYTRRYTYEGGQFRLFMKLPTRGFTNARFKQRFHTINLDQIDAMYEDGETVNLETLVEKGYLCGKTFGVKLLGNGELHKKVTIELDDISESAKEKLTQANISFSIAHE
jgi:large subunit ribosomal protein L15